MLHPGAQQIVRRLEIHRGDHGDQIPHLVLVQRGVAQAEGTALADAEQIDLIQTVSPANHVHAAIQVAVDVIVQRQAAVGAIRVAPVDQVDVLTGRQQILDGGTVLLDVGHVRTIDQRIGYQHWYRILRHALGCTVTVQRQLVLGVNRFLGCDTGIDLVGVQQVLYAFAEFAAVLRHLLGEFVGSNFYRIHQASP